MSSGQTTPPTPADRASAAHYIFFDMGNGTSQMPHDCCICIEPVLVKYCDRTEQDWTGEKRTCQVWIAVVQSKYVHAFGFAVPLALASKHRIVYIILGKFI